MAGLSSQSSDHKPVQLHTDEPLELPLPALQQSGLLAAAGFQDLPTWSEPAAPTWENNDMEDVCMETNSSSLCAQSGLSAAHGSNHASTEDSHRLPARPWASTGAFQSGHARRAMVPSPFATAGPSFEGHAAAPAAHIGHLHVHNACSEASLEAWADHPDQSALGMLQSQEVQQPCRDEAAQLDFSGHFSLQRGRIMGLGTRAAAFGMLRVGSLNGTVHEVRHDLGQCDEDHDSMQQGTSPERSPALSAFGRSLIASTPAAPPMPCTAVKGPGRGAGPWMEAHLHQAEMDLRGGPASGLEVPGTVVAARHRNQAMGSTAQSSRLTVMLADPQGAGQAGLPFLEVSQSPASSARSCWAPIKTSIENSSESRSQTGMGSLLAAADR